MSVFSQFGGGSPIQSGLPGRRFPGYASGGLYPPTLPIVSANAVGVALAQDTMHFVPFSCLRRRAFSAIGFFNTATTQSGRQVRLGIYRNGEGVPTSLVDEFTSGGALTLDASAAWREVTKTVTLDPLDYWLAIAAGGGAVDISFIGVGSAGASNDPLPSIHDYGIQQPATGTSNPVIARHFTASHTFAALPANAPALSRHSGSSSPLLALKAA